MSIETRLLRVRDIRNFAYPRARNLPPIVLEDIKETSEWWYLPCQHLFHPAATTLDIQSISEQTGYYVPIQLADILRHANGADLFRLSFPFQEKSWGEYQSTNYRILSHNEIINTNLDMREVYRDFAEDEMNFPRDSIQINYLAFCDVNDGDYLAVNLEEHHVFLLDHEYDCYPDGHESTREAYHFVADSIEGWLDKLINSNGWDGIGGKYIPL